MKSLEDIKALLIKNKKSFVKELKQSKEAFFLIKKAKHTSLNEDEKEKVKIQILDICKSLPAFAIFLLPGGSLLLPLLVKVLPEILPSSFRENEE